MPPLKQFDPEEGLEKAMLAFWSHGYEATSMQNLVDCMGINRGSLYATYGDKHALFMASLRMYDDKMRRQTLTELEARLPPRDAIRTLFLAFLPDGKSRHPGRGCFLTNTALERAPHDPEAQRIVAHAQEQIEGFFARMIRKEQALGHIHQDRDADTIARGLLAALIGLIVLTRSRPDPILLESVIADAMARLG